MDSDQNTENSFQLMLYYYYRKRRIIYECSTEKGLKMCTDAL